MPMSTIDPPMPPAAAPTAAPRNGTKKMRPNKRPQNAPSSAPSPAKRLSWRVFGRFFVDGQLTVAASSTSMRRLLLQVEDRPLGHVGTCRAVELPDGC